MRSLKFWVCFVMLKNCWILVLWNENMKRFICKGHWCGSEFTGVLLKGLRSSLRYVSLSPASAAQYRLCEMPCYHSQEIMPLFRCVQWYTYSRCWTTVNTVRKKYHSYQKVHFHVVLLKRGNLYFIDLLNGHLTLSLSFLLKVDWAQIICHFCNYNF